jgi:hypothetical protein
MIIVTIHQNINDHTYCIEGNNEINLPAGALKKDAEVEDPLVIVYQLQTLSQR